MHPLVFYSLVQFPRAETDTHIEIKSKTEKEISEKKKCQVDVRQDGGKK